MLLALWLSSWEQLKAFEPVAATKNCNFHRQELNVASEKWISAKTELSLIHFIFPRDITWTVLVPALLLDIWSSSNKKIRKLKSQEAGVVSKQNGYPVCMIVGSHLSLTPGKKMCQKKLSYLDVLELKNCTVTVMDCIPCFTGYNTR